MRDVTVVFYMTVKTSETLDSLEFIISSTLSILSRLEPAPIIHKATANSAISLPIRTHF